MKKVTYIFNIALVTVLMACTAASTYAKTINFAIASDVITPQLQKQKTESLQTEQKL